MRSKNLLLLFLFLFSPCSLTAVIIDGIAAIVNDDVITHSELYAMEKLELHLSGLPEEENLLQQRINHHLVLQQMVKQPPIALTEEESQTAVESYSGRHGGPERFQQFLSSIGMNYADFQQEVRDELSVRKFITERFRPFVGITIEDAEKYYNNVYKPEREKLGKEVTPFAESFNEIQTLMVESQVQVRIKDWLQEIRRSATINIKE